MSVFNIEKALAGQLFDASGLPILAPSIAAVDTNFIRAAYLEQDATKALVLDQIGKAGGLLLVPDKGLEEIVFQTQDLSEKMYALKNGVTFENNRPPFKFGNYLAEPRFAYERSQTALVIEGLFDVLTTSPFFPIDSGYEEMRAATLIFAKYGIAGADSIIMASTLRHKVIDFLTDDADFLRAPNVNVWTTRQDLPQMSQYRGSVQIFDSAIWSPVVGNDFYR